MWGPSHRKLPDEEVERLQRKLRPERRAYASCMKANKGSSEFCQVLERRLLERWSEFVAPEAAAVFQKCYTASLNRGDDVLDACSKEVEQMRKSLSQLSIDPVA